MSRDQWLATRPETTRDNDLVLAVWRFCGGWNPTVLPLAMVYYGVGDADLLIAQLLVMRGVIEAFQEANRGAAG